MNRSTKSILASLFVMSSASLPLTWSVSNSPGRRMDISQMVACGQGDSCYVSGQLTTGTTLAITEAGKKKEYYVTTYGLMDISQ